MLSIVRYRCRTHYSLNDISYQQVGGTLLWPLPDDVAIDALSSVSCSLIERRHDDDAKRGT